MTEVVSLTEARQRGLRFYYTGRPCKNGHVAKRRVNGAMCTVCEYERNKRYQEQNPERVREWKRESHSRRYKDDPEKFRRASREHYHANREQCLARSKKWFMDNVDRRRELKRQSTARNPDRNRERVLRWQRNNPDKVRVRSSKRRARERGADGQYTDEDIQRIFEAQRGRCASCREKLVNYHVDHVVALAAGGSNAPENIQLLCPSCNFSKGAKDPIEWANRNGRLL